MGGRLGDHAQAEPASDPSRLRADCRRRNVRAERGEGTGGRTGSEQHEVAPRHLRRPDERRVVERDEVRAELVDERPPCASGGGDEDAARRARELREQPFLGRHPRDEVGLDAVRAERLGRARADCRDARERAAPAPYEGMLVV